MMELDNIFKAEQVNISEPKWGVLTDSYQRRLNAEIELKGGSTKYNLNGVHSFATNLLLFFSFSYIVLSEICLFLNSLKVALA